MLKNTTTVNTEKMNLDAYVWRDSVRRASQEDSRELGIIERNGILMTTPRLALPSKPSLEQPYSSASANEEKTRRFANQMISPSGKRKGKGKIELFQQHTSRDTQSSTKVTKSSHRGIGRLAWPSRKPGTETSKARGDCAIVTADDLHVEEEGKAASSVQVGDPLKRKAKIINGNGRPTPGMEFDRIPKLASPRMMTTTIEPQLRFMGAKHDRSRVGAKGGQLMVIENGVLGGWGRGLTATADSCSIDWDTVPVLRRK